MPLRMSTRGVHAVDVLREASLYLGVLRRLRGIVRSGKVEVVVATVRTCHIGDVPDGVGTGGVEDRTARQGIGIAAHVLRAVALQRVRVVALPGVRRLVPHGGVQGVGLADTVEVLALRLPLGGDVLVGDGVGETGAVDADGRLQQHADLRIVLRLVECDVLAATSHHHRGIVSRIGNCHLRVNERVAFTVGELVAPLVGIVVPRYLDLILVDRRFERFDGASLRHTGHRADIGIGGLVVDNEQIAVAVGVGLVFRLTGSMTVAGMTVEAAASYIDGTEAVESSLGVGVVVLLKEILALIESRHHAGVLHCLRGLLKGCGGIHGSGAQQSAGVVVFGVVGGCRFAYLPRGGLNGIIIVSTTDDDECTQQQTTNN